MSESLKCVTLPLQHTTLLLPYTAVAEIVSFNTLETTDKTKNGLLGNINWRGQQIALISLEAMEPENTIGDLKKGDHIAILNRFSKEQQFDFIGIHLFNKPGLCKVSKEELTLIALRPHSFIRMEINFNKQEYAIPNLLWIADKVINL